MDKEKLKNIVLYVCNKVPPKNLGLLKLHKILWYSDLLYYMKTGNTITDEVYVKALNGPISSHLEKILNTLEKDNIITRTLQTVPYKQYFISSRQQADFAIFSDNELECINSAINFAINNLTKDISEATHGLLWENTINGQHMPIEDYAAELCLEKVPYDTICWNRYE